jgi:hypothetical protein
MELGKIVKIHGTSFKLILEFKNFYLGLNLETHKCKEIPILERIK